MLQFSVEMHCIVLSEMKFMPNSTWVIVFPLVSASILHDINLTFAAFDCYNLQFFVVYTRLLYLQL